MKQSYLTCTESPCRQVVQFNLFSAPFLQDCHTIEAQSCHAFFFLTMTFFVMTLAQREPKDYIRYSY